MTERLYFDDSYVDTFEATVEVVEDDAVVLDRTAFYPTGGGQPHDTGWLQSDGVEVAVTDVSGRERIEHAVDDASGFEPGDAVVGILDWDRRYALMQYHTAQHLFSAVLLEAFDAATTGNQLYPDRARIDCAYPRFEESDMRRIEGRFADLVAADHPVRTSVLDRETAESTLDTARTRIDLLPSSVTEVRMVEIGDAEDPIDRTACAGTHVASTGELPPLELTGRETKGSEEERLRFHLPRAGEPPV
ncbi:MAG: alanyl-tRNA editing protein [Halanaeroarchaeum sp.]